MAWRLQGTYIENCNCDVVCPCGASGFAAPADYDRCNAVLAWHIDSGHVDETDVSDRSVVLLLDAPKQLSEGNWRVGVFMDDGASTEQIEKLGAIFSGQVGGPMANIAPLVSENLGMEVAAIEFSDEGRRHRVRIGDAADIEVEDVASPLDPDGAPPRLTGTRHPANDTLSPAVARHGSTRWASNSPAKARAASRRRSPGRADPASWGLSGPRPCGAAPERDPSPALPQCGHAH